MDGFDAHQDEGTFCSDSNLLL